jgi:hypothetical protein
VGGIGALALIGLAAFLLWRRSKKSSNPSTTQTFYTPDSRPPGTGAGTAGAVADASTTTSTPFFAEPKHGESSPNVPPVSPTPPYSPPGDQMWNQSYQHQQYMQPQQQGYPPMSQQQYMYHPQQPTHISHTGSPPPQHASITELDGTVGSRAPNTSVAGNSGAPHQLE